MILPHSRRDFLGGLATAAVAYQSAKPTPREEATPHKERIPTKEPAPACEAKFVNCHNATPDCNPKTERLPAHCSADLYWIRMPGSPYALAANAKFATDENDRAVAFYKQYCIDLTFHEKTLPVKAFKRAEKIYKDWYDACVVAAGGAGHLGKFSLTKALIADFTAIATALQNDTVGAHKCLIVYTGEYIGASDNADTLCTSARDDLLQAGVNWVDRKSPYILAHELIHVFGKPAPDGKGTVTWQHCNQCDTSLCHVTRMNSRDPITNLANRYLDRQDYQEIVDNRAAGVLNCKKIK